MNLSVPAVQFLGLKTLGSLNRILQSFYTMYRHAYRLTWWNRNCDIPIHFGTPACWIVKLRASRDTIFSLCPLEGRSYWTNVYQILRDIEAFGESYGTICGRLRLPEIAFGTRRILPLCVQRLAYCAVSDLHISVVYPIFLILRIGVTHTLAIIC